MKRHLFFILLSALLLVALTALPAAAADSDWYRAEQDSFVLHNAAELAGLAELVNAGNDFRGVTVTLDAAQLDLSGVVWTPIGATRQTPWNGVFDGNGTVIEQLTVAGGECGGLFGYVGAAGAVKNCAVSGSISADTYAGAVAGYNQGLLSHCGSGATVSAAIAYAGGVTGYNRGELEFCYQNGVTAAPMYAGGLAGFSDGAIQSCYHNGATLCGGDFAGGIAGASRGRIDNCYNSGVVQAAGDFAGGVVGKNFDGGVDNCYSLSWQQADAACGALVGLATADAALDHCFYREGALFDVGATGTDDDFTAAAADSGTGTQHFTAGLLLSGSDVAGGRLVSGATLTQALNDGARQDRHFRVEAVWTDDETQSNWGYPVFAAAASDGSACVWTARCETALAAWLAQGGEYGADQLPAAYRAWLSR